VTPLKHSNQGKNVMPELEFCRNCTSYIDDDDAKCLNCGASRKNTIKGQFNQKDADAIKQGGHNLTGEDDNA
jgi:uncharacterized membrane protein YvbJ